MRPLVFLKLAAAFLWALLLAAPASAQTIVNTADARWTEGGVARSAMSNTVVIDRAANPVSLDILHPRPGGSSLPVRPSTCSGAALPLFAEGSGGGASVAIAADPTGAIHAGEVLIIRSAAPLANLDPNAIDRLTARITTPGGDREVLEIYETGPDTGIFTGAIATRPAPPAPTPGDCQLGVTGGETVTVMLGTAGSPAVLVAAELAILAVPSGFVFDSANGTPVSGASVTLIDAATGQPAAVFAANGTTPWPATVITGETVRDGDGNTVPLQPGEYRFPFVPPGRYRVVVTPPTPYVAPSTVQPPQLASFARPGGGVFVIAPSSFGNQFELASAGPLAFDVPVDRPGAAVTVTKTASRTRAQPGDTVFYTVTIANPDPAQTKRGVSLFDIPSPSLRFRLGSVRVDGRRVDDAVTVTPDGRRLAIAVDTVAPGSAVRVTYAMTVHPDAAPGQALNRAVASDRFGEAIAEVAVRVERDTIASRMTIVGRVTAGACAAPGDRIGIPGVRVMLEDGSLAITDADGRYHFEGVVPGTHVVQAQRQTLPEGGRFVDCERSTRSAGKAFSRFVTGQGGSLATVDFTADVPGYAAAASVQPAAAPGPAPAPAQVTPASSQDAAGNARDWLALGDGPDGFLFPEIDHNPRAPAVRVVVRHRAGQSVDLSAGGTPVDARALDAVRTSADGIYAVSIWRGVAIGDGTTNFTATIRNPDGSVAGTFERPVEFVAIPWRAELVPARSRLIADGTTRPVVAIRLTDRRGRPVHAGVTGSMTVGAPYESAALLDQLQLRQLSGQGSATPTWIIEGDDGIALVELAPTMISGPLHLSFSFADAEVTREQEIESWIVPGDLEWTVVGLAEGSVGARTVADNMERTGRFDSDLGDNARVALYAKGRVLGRFIATLAYDSAADKDDRRLFGAIDPETYYTVFADRSDRRFDAASREKLYIRVESSTFYAMYGDILTGFDQTVLGRYERAATGVKAEGLLGALHAEGFAAKIATRYRRDEIQGSGLSGPYRLSDRDIAANSELVAIEVRDRLRSEVIVERRELVRFIDYDIDLLSGTIRFKEPVLSRDFDLNPQFIVIDYEVLGGLGTSAWNAGVRADYTIGDAVRLGVTGITDKGDGARTELGAVDVRARVGAATEVRAELGLSRTAGADAAAWLVEAEHRSGALDLVAYARSIAADYGTGQQNGVELGRRKVGIDARYAVDERLSLVGSAWYDESLTDAADRRAVQVAGTYRGADGDVRLGIARLDDRLADGSRASSTVLEGAVSRRLLDDRLELSATTSIALDDAASIDLPARHRLRARYTLFEWLRLVGTYEIADGETIDARTFNAGFELTPWQGSRLVASLGQQDIAEQGKRSFAAFGLSQTFAISPELSIDATIDGNREFGGAGASDLVNPLHPAAAGGHLSQGGALFENFTAVTLGGSWRRERWSATARGEYRDGAAADRKGFTAGIVRQIDDGFVVGSGLTWTRMDGEGGPTGPAAERSEVWDAGMAVAFRPAARPFAFLGKLAYRSDSIRGAATPGAFGGTALDGGAAPGGDAAARRLVASLSTDWTPYEPDEDDAPTGARRTNVGLFLGARHNFDRADDLQLTGTTLLGGLDLRIGVGERVEIGGRATLRASLGDGVTSYAFGPEIGFTPATDTLVTVGYNVAGFRDRDFGEARNTDKGFFAAVRFKIDADSFSFLGLGR